MVSTSNSKAAIYVDRTCTKHWIVRDPDGIYWLVPSGNDAWDARLPYRLTEESELQPIPGHYLAHVGLPF